MPNENLHPAGSHPAVVVDHGIGLSGKNPAVTVKFETAFGYITGWFHLTNKAAEYTAKKLAAMGFIGSSFEELNMEPPKLRGNKCTITVSHEDYTNADGEKRTTAKVGWVNEDGFEGFEVKKDADAAATSRQFDAILHKLNKDKPKPATPADGEEVPF